MKLTRIISAVTLTAMIMLSVTALMPSTAQAATRENCQGVSDRILQFPTWYKYLNPQYSETTVDGITSGECNIDFTFPADIGKLLLAVFEILLRIAGILAIIFTIWGGFQYILSQGEPERASNARSTIVNALIGLAIAISAVAIVNLIGRNLA